MCKFIGAAAGYLRCAVDMILRFLQPQPPVTSYAHLILKEGGAGRDASVPRKNNLVN